MSAAPGTRIPAADLKLDEVLRLRAESEPDAPALIYAREPHVGQVCTWGELDGLADAFAVRLLQRGAGAGERVAIILTDSAACIAAVYGILRIGAIVVPIDSAWGPVSIRSTLVHSSPVLLAAAETEALNECGLHDFGPQLVTFCDQPGTERIAARGDVDDVAMLAFTSGTTSQPKGVAIRHRHFRAAYRAGADLLELRTVARFGCIFRLSGLGILGMHYFLAHEVGAATVVLPEFSLGTAKLFFSETQRHAIEFVYLVPAVVQIMNKVAAPPVRDLAAATPLRCVTAAAPISRQVHAEFQERFGVPLRNAYGLTEASFAVFFGEPAAGGLASPSIGQAIAVQARLVSSGGAVVTGAGNGELQIRGPMVSDGYWDNREATGSLFQDGWLRTGDLAERDAEGRYQIRGRIKDVVIRGGFNIHLAEVEETLFEHPEVCGACAVGMADAFTGEELYAAVQLSSAAGDVHTIERWARARLGQGRAPRRIFVVPELPRNGAGKVVRAQVVAQITAALKHGASAQPRTPRSP
jgi:acyl-CoA synthetase (AMP-forming)/AMP-acid ligase II